MRFPCVKKKGLKIFKPTADQRYELGEDVFMRTHFTLTMRRYRGTELVETWNENDILELLESGSEKDGNRVIILFGAAGSGKSEAIRFLDINARSSSKRNNRVFRISRTELDPVKILNKLINLVDDDLDKRILIKWEILKKKPVALANSLIWNSLNNMLESDDEIVPLSYKLRPLIENNLRNSFINKEKINNGTIELLSFEQWEEVRNECVINFNLDYEQLRKHINYRFEDEVLGGYSFINTLKEVGKKVESMTGKRPLLLIDDLVQSMSIYSSDLLDYFITLEEGNWDIVIGLTPASFESSKRGKDILNRITYLDTIDDRVHKLWLTDEFGNESYSINNETVKEYIKQYLLEFKRINGYECGEQCNNYIKCCSLHWDCGSEVVLTPLNQPLIQRMYSSLFKGKGQSRHIIVTVKEFLSSIIEKNEVKFLSDRVSREKNSDIENLDQKIIVESYLPLDTNNTITLSPLFLRALGYKNKKSKTLKLNNLSYIANETNIINELATKSPQKLEPEIVAIRDWLENKEVNVELLRGVRLSIDYFLKEFMPNNGLIRQGTPKLKNTVKSESLSKGCRFPLSLEGVDSKTGIIVNKSLGSVLYSLIILRQLGLDTQKDVIEQLWEKPEFIRVLEEAKEGIRAWRETFESSLDIKCEELAFLLYSFIYHTNVLDNYPYYFSLRYRGSSLSEIPFEGKGNIKPLSEKAVHFAIDFFNDWFQLRESLYDGFLIKDYIEKYPDIRAITLTLSSIDSNRLKNEYRYNNFLVRDVLCETVDKAKSIMSLLDSSSFKNNCIFLHSELNDLTSLTQNDLEKIKSQVANIKSICKSMGHIIVLEFPDLSINNIKIPADLDYPNNISAIAKYSKSEGYKSLKSFKYHLLSTYKEFNDYLQAYDKNGNESIASINKTIQLDCNSLGIRELVCVVENFFEEAYTVKMNNATYKLRDYIKPHDQDAMYDMNLFFNALKNVISYDVQKFYNIDKIKQVIKANMEMPYNDNCEFKIEQVDIKESIYYINKKKLSMLKKDICDLILRRINFLYQLIEENNRCSKRDAIKNILTLTGDGVYNDYDQLAHHIEECKRDIIIRLKEPPLILGDNASKIVESFLGYNNISLNDKNYNAFIELNEKMPHVSRNIEFFISLKASLGD